MKIQAISEGIMHGPYLGLSAEEVRDYIQDQVGTELTDQIVEKLYDDTQSDYQYEQSCFAVQDAIKEGRIEQGVGLFVMSKVLKPWSRNIRALYYDS